MIFLANYLYCVLWAGHKARVRIEKNNPYDVTYCERCGAVQGSNGWWNVGFFRRLRT